MVEDLKLKINQFEKFYYFLMKEAPQNYTPWFFPCEPKGKDPCPSAILKIDSSSKGSWHHPSAKLSKDQVIEHIKQGYNIGLSAREGDPLIIIDVDNPKYFKDIPTDTLTAQSRKRKGGHIFCWDKDGSAKINLPTDHGEIRSNNQYVLSCGSYVPFDLENKKDKKAFDELPEGAREDKLIGYYTILTSEHPKEITFSEVPQFFKDKQEENLEVETKILQTEEKNEYKKEGKYSDLFSLKVSDILGKIPAKKRTGHPLHESDTDANFSLTKDGTLGHCWRHLVSLNAVQYLCIKNGYSKCEDAGTPHKGRGISKIRGDKKAYKIAYEEATKLGLIEEYKGKNKTKNEFLIINYDKKGEETSRSVNIDSVVDHLIEKNHFKIIEGKKSNSIYVFNGKFYTPNGDNFIKQSCENLLGVYAKINSVNEILAKIGRKKDLVILREDFDKVDTNFIPLENGLWNLKKKRLEKHDSKYNFKTIIPIKYNPSSECKRWKRFLEEAIYPENILLTQKWFGFNLLFEYLIKKGMIVLGETDTGKTILLNVLGDLVGLKNKTGIPLQKISSGNDFIKISLYGKLANIFDDLSSQDLSDGGGFKVATGGGDISAEEKFGDYIQFKSIAKQTFSANKIPPVKDNDDMAYYSRWIINKMDNPPEKKDLDLGKKLRKEMEGILKWSLEGLDKLLKDKHFSFFKTPEEVKEIMESSGNQLTAFALECLKESEGSKITKENMFVIYSVWAKENKKPRLSKEQLGRRLEKSCHYILAKVQKNIRFWEGAIFKEEFKSKIISKGYTTLTTLLKKPYREYREEVNNDIINDVNLVNISGRESVVSVVKKNPIKNDFTKKELDQAAPQLKEFIENNKK